MDEVRIADLKTFLAVHRSGSISSAARQLRVTPSQVSKAIARLEEHAGARLLARGARGISLTEQGHEIVPRVVSALAAVGGVKGTKAKASEPLEITVAGASYLVTHLVPVIAAADPRLKVCGLELWPPHLRAYLTDNVFDLALLPGKVPARPSAWTTDAVGELRMSLLGPKTLAQRLAPLPTTVERRVGHETQTIGSALELAASSQQRVFGPARRDSGAGLARHRNAERALQRRARARAGPSRRRSNASRWF